MNDVLQEPLRNHGNGVGGVETMVHGRVEHLLFLLQRHLLALVFVVRSPLPEESIDYLLEEPGLRRLGAEEVAVLEAVEILYRRSRWGR